MDIVQLIISLLSGVAGGNVAGAVLKDNGLGTAGNSVAGLFGGGIGGYLMQILGLLGTVATSAAGQAVAANTGFDLTHLLSNIGGSGLGGLLLTVIVSLIKNAAANKV